MLAGVSQSFVSLVERGQRRPNWPTACGLASAAGHDLSIRLFPADGVRLRDRGQLGAVEAIVAQAHGSWRVRLEHPIASGDRRAADLVLESREEILHIEVEGTLVDLQAQLRAAQLKRAALAQQFGRAVRLVLAVPGTRRSRSVLASIRQAIAPALPTSSAVVWRSIRTGMPLDGDGLLLLPPRPRQPQRGMTLRS
jgi:hypothetical protein